SSQTVYWQHERHQAEHVQARNRIERRLAQVTEGARATNWGEFANLKRQENYHAAGQRLHELYWQVLGGSGGEPEGELMATIERCFGSFAAWQADFLATAEATRNGWTILLWDRGARQLSNIPVEQQHVGALWQSTPLLPVDLWEHAYYYDHGPDRGAYLDAFLSNVNWQAVENLFSRRM
ncbi:MAG: superoxide dismutase, partial [Ardenticatenaceae bacterium]